jgi:aminoglycoside phosphotransferase family enzyme
MDRCEAAGLDAKVAFLRSPAAHGGAQPVTTVETHMSWVFLAGDRVLKLKKPVRHAFLDFSTSAARAFFCREEVRLNARLAPGVYLGVLALCRRGGAFVLEPAEEGRANADAVDWLVSMRRLPAAQMLDARIAAGRVAPGDVDALAALLARFYASAPAATAATADRDEVLRRVRHELAIDREVLLDARWALPDARAVLDALDAAVECHAALLRDRAARGRIVDGHGDLRPEHVCLVDPPVVIDCLEFNAALREVDPFDELAFLGLECAVAGAAWIGPRLVERCAQALGDRPPAALVALYTALRASLRARLAMAHLLDDRPRTPEVWPVRAAAYLRHAGAALQALDGTP